MEVYTLYVGQGNLSVVVKGTEAIIVDSKIPSRNDLEAVFVKEALSKILRNYSLVGLILTGFDADHADPRGVRWILGKYRPDWVMYPKYYKPTKNAREVFNAIREHDLKRHSSYNDLERISVRLDQTDKRFYEDLSDEWKFEVFSPHPEDMNSSNNCSLVVKVIPKEDNGFTYLVTGDTENDRWKNINRIFRGRLKSDVMAIPHHGSKNGINEDTLGNVGPTVVLISAGIDNQFGHPHDETLDILDSYGIECHSTHEGQSLRTTEGWLWGITTEVWDG